MNVSLVSITESYLNNSEGQLTPEELIVYTARVSNPGNQMNMETSDRLLAYLVRNKHWSPFEMVDMTVEIKTSRAIAQQILRHRSFSFQEFCISGDSKVKVLYPNAKTTKNVAIADLYASFTEGDWGRIGTPQAKVYDRSSMSFVYRDIVEVFKPGEKEVYMIDLHGGKSIKATKEHKFLTKRGFVELKDLTTDDFIAVNGVPVHQDGEWLAQAKEESLSRGGVSYIADKAGVSYHTIRKWLKIHSLTYSKAEISLYTNAWNRGLPKEEQPNYGNNHSYEVREKMRRASKSGAGSLLYTGSVIPWRKQVANECIKYKALLAERQGVDLTDLHLYDVDHVLPVYSHPELAFDIDNLQLLLKSKHKEKSISEMVEAKYTAKFVPVRSINYVGRELTYDLEVDHVEHNYVANGIVTHNSQRYAEVTDMEPLQLRMAGSTNRQSSTEEAIFGPDDTIKVSDALYGAGAHIPASQAVYVALQTSQEVYRGLLSLGVAKECARMVLPVTAQTTIYMKGSVRSWIHYLQIRCDEHTQLEHREVALGVLDIFKVNFPNIAKGLFVSQ